MDLNALIAQGGTQNVQPPNQLDLYTKAMALQHVLRPTLSNQCVEIHVCS